MSSVENQITFNSKEFLEWFYENLNAECPNPGFKFEFSEPTNSSNTLFVRVGLNDTQKKNCDSDSDKMTTSKNK